MIGLIMNIKSSNSLRSHFTCKHCQHCFVSETRYLNHKCKEMKRLEEFKLPIGQAAWSYYQQWFKVQNKMPPPGKGFLTSKYYRTFVKFAQHVSNVGLPKPDKFIWLMKEKDLPPTIWTANEVYSLYLEYLDRTSSPIDQAKLSVETLLNLADKANVDVSNIFEILTPNDIINLLRRRQLSPWLLLCSKKFKLLFKDKTTPEQKIILEVLIRADYWSDKLKQHATDLETIKQYVRELNV